MWPGGQFVDEDPVVCGVEHLYAGYSSASGGVGRGPRHALGLFGHRRANGGGAQQLAQHVVVLAGLHHRVHGVAASMATGHHHGEFALEVHKLLHQHTATALGQHRVGGAGLVEVRAQGIAVAVVAKVARLEHERPAQIVADGLEVVGGIGHRERRNG